MPPNGAYRWRTLDIGGNLRRVTAVIVEFSGEHLDGVLALCRAEGWPSLPEDPARALRALTAPGVTTMVALAGSEVVGFAQVLSDGEIQAYLASIAVTPSRRGSGVARSLIDAAVAGAGGTRLDLLSEEDAVGFYASLPHRRKPGFRLYPPFDQPLEP